ncbi:reverse transcriptase domain-containing protein [Tanacetum coccineum]
MIRMLPTSPPTLTPFGDSEFFASRRSRLFPSNSSVDEPTEVELKELPPHLEYAFLEGDNKLPVIIAKELDVEEKSALVKTQGKPDTLCTKKGGITVVLNRKRVDSNVVSHRMAVCIDYRKLNEATRKDHFPLPFMDQMLERLAGNEYYCFLDGFSGYFQIPIDPRDQEKTTFTCPYGTLRRRWKSLWTLLVFGNSSKTASPVVIHMLQRIARIVKTLRSGYHQKDRKPSQNDKTEHGMEKTVQNQGQSPKMPKLESILKNTIECNLYPSDGPGKPNNFDLLPWLRAFGIARDVLVPVGKFTFPADFVVVDFECNYQVPLILGRPFLRTARVLIDVHGEELVIRDGLERIVFKPDGSQDNESIHMMDVYDDRFKDVCEPESNDDSTTSAIVDEFESLLGDIIKQKEELKGISDPVARRRACFANLDKCKITSQGRVIHSPKKASISAISHIFPNNNLEDSFTMGNEDLNSIPNKELNKEILIPIPRESKIGKDCDFPSCDDFQSFKTFSNPLPTAF